MSDNVLLCEMSLNLFYALGAVSVFVNRATIHGTGALLVEDQRVVLNTDVLQNDCDCAHSRCCAVQPFVIGAEMYDETRLIQDYRM